MHSTLPSSLARFRQPSRATSKNGLFIAFGTTAKRYLVWASAGLAAIATAMAANRTFLIGPPPRFSCLSCRSSGPEADRRRRCWRLPASIFQVVPLKRSFSGHARAHAVDQHRQDDDHPHQGLLPVRIDLRAHEPVADGLEQEAADAGAARG